MGIQRIDKKSYAYLFLKNFVGFWHNHVFYRRIFINNSKNVPRDAHLIFTGNHQNALMDSLVFLFGVKSRLVFMARSDIFQNPFLAAALYFLRMLPIFRIKDGYSAVKKNDEIFQKTIDVIKNKIGLVIMAEGNHAGERRLRPLKKGFARIAFQTEQANDFKLNMQVVPVGIDYSSYEDFRTELLINFGEPIAVSDYLETYKSSPAIAINQIKERLAESLKPLMVHIESEDYYDLYNELREIYKTDLAKKMGFPSTEQPYKLKCDQELIRKLAHFEAHNKEDMGAFQNLVLRYRDELRKQKLDYEVVRSQPKNGLNLIARFMLLLISSPFFIIGFLLNYLPFGISIWASKKFKDPQFFSSVKYAVTLFLYPLYHFALSIGVWFLFKSWEILFAFFVGMPILGIIARKYWEQARDYVKNRKWLKLKNKQTKVYQSILENQKEILRKTNAIVVEK
jgi:1-acyl-sn-glycerol-3-phosphate acyltransferase